MCCHMSKKYGGVTMTLYGKLLERERNGAPIKVGVIGAGQMGFGMIAQISTIPGMAVTGISDINKDAAQRAADAYNASAEKKVDILVSSDFKEIIHSDKLLLMRQVSQKLAPKFH